MPLIKVISYPHNSKMYLWHIQESNSYFTSKLRLSANTIADIDRFHKKRQLEWLVARYIVQLLGYDHEDYIKDENGKPHIDQSGKYISISHSKNMLAFLISDVSCGIDIQYQSPKILRIKEKFVHPKEQTDIDQRNNQIEDLHNIWCTKEAIYKAYGRKKVSFKKDIIVDLHNSTGTLRNSRYNIINQFFSKELASSVVFCPS